MILQGNTAASVSLLSGRERAMRIFNCFSVAGRLAAKTAVNSPFPFPEWNGLPRYEESALSHIRQLTPGGSW